MSSIYPIDSSPRGSPPFIETDEKSEFFANTQVQNEPHSTPGNIQNSRLDLSAKSINDEELAKILNPLPDITTLRIRSDKTDKAVITDQSLLLLAQLKGLKDLNLEICCHFGNGISDQGLSYLSSLKNLRRLHLTISGSSQLTSKGVQCLAELSQLEILDLSIEVPRCAIQGQVENTKAPRLCFLPGFLKLDFLHPMESTLKHLHLDLYSWYVKEEELVNRLSKCTNLEKLELVITSPSSKYIENFFITDKVFNFLPHLEQLKQLSLSIDGDCSLEGNGFAHFKHLSKLEELSLRISGRKEICVKDRNLDYLSSLSSLKSIELVMNVNGGTETVGFLKPLEENLTKLCLYFRTFQTPQKIEQYIETLSTPVKRVNFQLSSLN